jgi:putative PIN family toxin of toxin-antitoxin system
MKVVLDTNVVVSAFLSPRGAPAQVLRYFQQEAFELLVSPPILQEYAAALRYDRVRKAHKLTDAQIESALEDLKAVAILVMPAVIPAVVAADTDDDKFFACAVAGRADIIVSGDAHVQAVKQHQGIPVLAPAAFVALLAQGG